MVSIITPSYNSARFLSETIESVLIQSYTNWEMIIVDDCSTDASFDIASEYATKCGQIMVIQAEKNGGAAKARNIGVAAAKGEMIAFLDSDDVWEWNKLEVQLQQMEKSKALFSFTSYNIISASNERIGLFKAPCRTDYNSLLKGSAIGCSTVMYNAELLGKQYFNLKSPNSREDYILWLSIAKILSKRNTSMVGINEPLVNYRKHGKGISSNKPIAAINQWMVYRNIEKLTFASSFYYFLHYAINAIKKHYF